MAEVAAPQGVDAKLARRIVEETLDVVPDFRRYAIARGVGNQSLASIGPSIDRHVADVSRELGRSGPVATTAKKRPRK